MPSYAAIRLTKETVVSVLGNVADVPAGRERLVWAIFKYQYKPGTNYYYIGGNYLGLTQPDFTRQILDQVDLDLRFTYPEQKKVGGRPDPYVNWFVVKLRENVSEAMIIG
jgi:hypothetical protein